MAGEFNGYYEDPARVDDYLEDVTIQRKVNSALYYNVYFIVIVGITYLAVYSWYLFAAHWPLAGTLVHGYPRQADLLPGTHVSDRYGLSWLILAFMAARVLVPLAYIWMLKGELGAGKKNIHMFLAKFFFTVGLVLVIALLIIRCLFCNTGSVISLGLCNDARFCEAYAADYPDRCPMPTVPLDPTMLTTNPRFLNLLYFSLAFLGLDLLMVTENRSLRKSVRRYLFMLMGRTRRNPGGYTR